jgi:hypothetical protein
MTTSVNHSGNAPHLTTPKLVPACPKSWLFACQKAVKKPTKPTKSLFFGVPPHILPEVGSGSTVSRLGQPDQGKVTFRHVRLITESKA